MKQVELTVAANHPFINSLSFGCDDDDSWAYPYGAEQRSIPFFVINISSKEIF